MKRACRFIKVSYLKHNKLKFEVEESLKEMKNFLSKIKTVQEIRICRDEKNVMAKHIQLKSK